MRFRCNPAPIAASIFAFVALWIAGSTDDPGLSMSSSSHSWDLVRDTSVIDAKLAHKQAKLASGEVGDRPQAPHERQEWRRRRKVNDDGIVPRNGLMLAKQHLEAARALEKDGGLAPTWDWRGPGNIGGRVRAAVFDPDDSNHLFLGAVGGGIWESSDQGASWAPVNDFLASLAVCSMAAELGGGGIFYAGTGEGFGNSDALIGAGVFRSMDGGNTWVQMMSTVNANFDRINRITMHPSEPGHLYLASETGVWESTDYAVNWTQILNRQTPDNVYDIDVFEAPASNELWLVAGSRRGLHVSTDGGANWTNRCTGNTNELPAPPAPTPQTIPSQRCEAVFAPRASNQDPYIYVSVDTNGGVVYRSTDGGTTWTQRSSSSVNYLGGQGWYDNVIWAEPGNANRVIVGGIDLWRSTDGAQTFTRMSAWGQYHLGNSAHADQHLILPDPGYDSSTNPRIFFGNDGGLQKKDDAWTGSTTTGWTNLANGLGITQFYHGAAWGGVLIGGAQDNSVLQGSTGLGNNGWVQRFTGDGADVAIDPTSSLIRYGSTQYLSIIKSTDGGVNWFNAVSGLSDAGSQNTAGFIAPFELDPIVPTNLVAGGLSIWRSVNGANSWSSIRSSLGGSPPIFCSAIAISSQSSGRIWVGYDDGTVSRTTTFAGNFADVHTNGLPAGRVVTDIAIHPTDQNEVVVVFGGFNTNNVWRTQDNGSNWENISGVAPFDLPAIPVSTVVYHPDNPSWLYIGTDLGVLASEDGGQSWSRNPVYGSGNEGPVNTEVADLFFDGPVLYAATHGRGMWITAPYVDVWVDWTNGGVELGTPTNPFNTVGEALGVQGNGTNIWIRNGTYTENSLLFLRRGLVQGVNGVVVVE